MLASQTQNGQATSWALDPTEQRFASATSGTLTTTTDHYSDSGSNPIWISGSDGSWTRYVTDINGMLAADVTSTGVTLELPNLQGDVMATASTSASATAPTATYLYNEFGIVETANPGSYGWQGSSQIAGTGHGGQLLMGARAYNPYTGRFSQADPVPGGSANSYDYASQNPVTNSDLTGMWLMTCQWGKWSGSCNTRFTSWESREIIAVLNLIEHGAEGCDAIAGVIPGAGEIIDAVCLLVQIAAGGVKEWLDGLYQESGERGIGLHSYYFKVVWWWFGQHHRWVLDWAWPYAR